jgi:hypothetical protein
LTDVGHDDELELADRLREVLDTPAPPCRTNVDAVISRGRWRLALQRASAVLGVVVMVGGISFAALALRGVGGRGGAQIPPAAAPLATATTSQGQPGQAWSPVPPSQPPGVRCNDASPQLPTPGLPPEAPAIAAFVAGLRDAAGQRHVGDPMAAHKDNANSVDVFAEVSDAGGAGSVHLSWSRYVGDPLAAATKDAFRRGGCDALYRTVRRSGAVLQLRQNVTAVPPETINKIAPNKLMWPYLEPSPQLAIYLPNEQVYGLTESRYAALSAKALSAVPHDIAARPTLPLTDQQLQAVAENFVSRLGF